MVYARLTRVSAQINIKFFPTNVVTVCNSQSVDFVLICVSYLLKRDIYVSVYIII